MGRDQHAVAACVEHRRLGVVVPMTASPDELRTTIASALADVALHQRARRFAARQDVAAGRERAVAVLEHL
jgi:UDP:flavonoid glycosyltransferase YjiC (YdhE family)